MLKILQQIFHGKGSDAYITRNAKKKFAKSSIKLADKLFWAPIVIILATGLTGSKIVLWSQIVFMIVVLVLAMWARHEGLKTLDTLPPKNKKTPSKKINVESV